MRYRFFGTDLPCDQALQTFLDYDERINADLSDLDKVYWPLLKIQRKLIFEYQRYAYKVKSKKVNYVINWKDADTLEESLKKIITGLKLAKRRYHANDGRDQRKGTKIHKSIASTDDNEDDDDDDEEEEEEEEEEEGKSSENADNQQGNTVDDDDDDDDDDNDKIDDAMLDRIEKEVQIVQRDNESQQNDQLPASMANIHIYIHIYIYIYMDKYSFFFCFFFVDTIWLK